MSSVSSASRHAVSPPVVAAIAGNAAADTVSDFQKIMDNYATALKAGDVETLVGLYSAKGVFMREEMKAVVGQDALRAAYKEVFATLKVDLQFTIRRPRSRATRPGCARVSKGTVKILKTGVEAKQGYNQLVVFRKEGGAWKIRSLSLRLQPGGARPDADLSAMSDERYTVLLGDRRYAIHRKWAKLPAGESFGFLSDLLVDGEGHVHVAQRGTDRPVLVFDRDGRQIGSWGEGTLAEPHYINAGNDGAILVADRDAHQVLRFDTARQARAGAGQAALALARRAVQPSDRGGRGAPTARSTSPTATATRASIASPPTAALIRTWGGPGSGPGAFTTPHAIAVDRRGRVLVARPREQPRAGVRPRRASSSPNGATSITRCRSGSTTATWCSSPTRSRASACSRSTASWSAAAAAPSTARTAWRATPTATSISPNCRRRKITKLERLDESLMTRDAYQTRGRSGTPPDLDAAHQAAERAGVAQRDVLGAAIVPEGDRALLPAEAEGEFRPVAVLEQEVEQRLALGRGHALDADRVGRVDEQASCGRSRGWCARPDGCCASRASRRRRDSWSSGTCSGRPAGPPCRCRCARRAGRRAASSWSARAPRRRGTGWRTWCRRRRAARRCRRGSRPSAARRHMVVSVCQSSPT